MEPALLAVVEGGNARGDDDGPVLTVDEPFPQEAGQVERAAETPPAPGGDVEAEEVGDRAGTQQGGPVAADGGVVGVVAGVAVPVGEKWPDPGTGEGGGPGDLRCPRDRRGFHQDGRTDIQVGGPGGCGGHGT